MPRSIQRSISSRRVSMLIRTSGFMHVGTIRSHSATSLTVRFFASMASFTSGQIVVLVIGMARAAGLERLRHPNGRGTADRRGRDSAAARFVMAADCPRLSEVLADEDGRRAKAGREAGLVGDALDV